MKIEKLKGKKAELLSKMENLVETAEDNLTAEEQVEFDNLKAEFDKTTKSIENAETLLKAQKDAEVDANRPAPAVKRVVVEGAIEDHTPSSTRIVLPAEVRKSFNLKAFTGPDANEKAYSFGMWIKGACGDYNAGRWCYERGIGLDKFATAMNSTTDSAGGYLVPTEYSADMAKLAHQYGIARRECKNIPLGSDTYTRPKDLTGTTAYFVNESSAITESSKTWGQITLSTKDVAILSRITRQLSQDALINLSDSLMTDMATQFAYKEDDSLFNGDGSSSYGSITGLLLRLETEYGFNDGKATVKAATADTVAITDLRKMISKIPAQALLGSKWYVNPAVYHVHMASIADGKMVSVADVQSGIGQDRFMGFPVAFTQVLDSTIGDNSSWNTFPILFGNLSLCADFGDRQSYSLDFSDSATIGGENVFERGQIAVRGTERIAITVHSYGDGDELTPICGLAV